LNDLIILLLQIFFNIGNFLKNILIRNIGMPASRQAGWIDGIIGNFNIPIIQYSIIPKLQNISNKKYAILNNSIIRIKCS